MRQMERNECCCAENTVEISEKMDIIQEADEPVNSDCSACSHKTKVRSEKESRELMNRLKRIEGQVRGIQRMLERNAYCTDIIIQVAAVNAALSSFNRVLLTNHLHTCVAEDIRSGNDEVIDELAALLQKVMK